VEVISISPPVEQFVVAVALPVLAGNELSSQLIVTFAGQVIAGPAIGFNVMV
jgi:hypothetical protein